MGCSYGLSYLGTCCHHSQFESGIQSLMFRILFGNATTALGRLAVLVFSLAGSCQADVTAPATDNSTRAWFGGTPHLDLRLRHEGVEDDRFSRDASATTLRVRLNYHTAQRSGLSMFGELDSVLNIGSDDYNSGSGTSGPERAVFPVVADPDGTEINQLYLQYKHKKLMARAGRQRILFDNQRFVGGVGWRQNEQTYDAILIQATPDDRLTATYAYVDNVNRIFGDDVSAGDHDNVTHLLNIKRKFGEASHVTGHLYRLHNQDAPEFSTLTYGIGVQAPVPGFTGLLVNADVLDQKSVANNPKSVGGVYWHVYGRYDYDAVQVFAGIEQLPGHASEAGRAFRTPLATLHAFNGWADQFLTTPDRGLTDIYAGLKSRNSAVNWQIAVHAFEAQKGSSDYGTEIDVSVSKTWSKKYELLIKYASFNGRMPLFADTQKLWLMGSAGF